MARKQKDLGEMTENLEEGVENLKNKKFTLLGIGMTPTTIGVAFGLLTSVLATLYGGFETYKAFQEMSEKLEVMDIEAVEARNLAIETKLADAIDYTRDIKNSLRDDIIRTERVAESASNRVKAVQDTIDERLREVSDLSRESEKDVRNTMREVEDRIDLKMEKLDEDLRDTLQKYMDNPLGGN